MSMSFKFTGRNIEITAALQQYITEKFARLERRGDNITGNVEVTLTVDKLRQIAAANIHASVTIHAEAEDRDMYAAIDALVDKLNHQIVKHREKETAHRKKEGDSHHHQGHVIDEGHIETE